MGPLKVQEKVPDPKTPKFRDFYPTHFGQFLSEIRITPVPNTLVILSKFSISPSIPSTLIFIGLSAALLLSTSIVETVIYDGRQIGY